MIDFCDQKSYNRTMRKQKKPDELEVNKMQRQCVEAEMEYRAWREAPLWYCVKTKLYDNGKMESEIVKDEKTKLPIAIASVEKPQDGVFAEVGATTYYTYCQG